MYQIVNCPFKCLQYFVFFAHAVFRKIFFGSKPQVLSSFQHLFQSLSYFVSEMHMTAKLQYKEVVILLVRNVPLSFFAVTVQNKLKTLGIF